MSSTSLYFTSSTTKASKPHCASTKRRVRFTFGYSSRTPSFGSLPPSPTDPSTQAKSSTSTSTSPSSSSSSSTVITSTSLPIMHKPNSIDTTATKTYSGKPTADDLSAMTIPTRTSSITSSCSTYSTLAPSSRPTSRCSSINSKFSYNGSLDHRTMHRPSTPSFSAHKSNSSISSSTTMNSPTSPVQPIPSTSSDSPATTVATRRPSVIERSAFLASAPVRSRAQISPRIKNMCPAPSASSLGTASTTFFSNASLPSLTTRCLPSFQTNNSSCCLMSLGGVSLEKRRWSNDSTRGIYGGVESTASSGTLSFLSNDDGRTSTSSSSVESIFNEEESIERSKKKKAKKVKKPCATLALFSFMLKK